MADARRTALKILTNIERSKSYSHLALKESLAKSALSPQDAAFATRLVYGAVEKKITLDYYIRRFSGKGLSGMHPLVLNILRLGVYQLLFMEKVPASAAVNESVKLVRAVGQSYAKGFVNAVLRNAARGGELLALPEGSSPEALEIRYSCPKELIEKWTADYGQAAATRILEAMETPPPHAARVNTLKMTREALLERLAREGVPAAPGEQENTVLFEKLPDLNKLPAFLKGLFHIQGSVSQLCCFALSPQPGESVLDLCAAPGGKSFTIAEMMDNRGRVVACELYENRLSLVRQGAERLGITIIETAVNDASVHNESLGLFDRVLCDAPCSGFGVMGGKPEIKYKRLDEIKNLPALQIKILNEGAAHVRSGGVLVYSTCTLNKDENESVAARFLTENPDFEPFFKTFFPEPGKTEGFFIARFKRKPE